MNAEDSNGQKIEPLVIGKACLQNGTNKIRYEYCLNEKQSKPVYEILQNNVLIPDGWSDYI